MKVWIVIEREPGHKGFPYYIEGVYQDLAGARAAVYRGEQDREARGMPVDELWWEIHEMGVS